MTWVDSLLNLYKWVNCYVAQMESEHKFVEISYGEIWKAGLAAHHNGISSQSEVAKKMGLVNALVNKTDHEALTKNDMAYFDPQTKTTAFMEMILMDGMGYEGLLKFRTMYLIALDEPALLASTRSEKQLNKVWSEKTMYPSIFTGSLDNTRVSGEKRLEQWEKNEDFKRVEMLMRSRFLIGAWIRKDLTTDDCNILRGQIWEYIIKNPQFVDMYSQMLSLAEPSGTLGDTMVWKAANRKRVFKSQPAPAPIIAEDFEREVNLSEWPFENYNSYHIPIDQPVQDSASLAAIASQPSQAFGKTIPVFISRQNVSKYGGLWLNTTKCANCEAPNPENFCALHQVVLCLKCALRILCT